MHEDLDELFSHAANLRSVPSRFTIRSIHYTHGVTETKPLVIGCYEQTVFLFSLLSKMADHTDSNGTKLHYIKSHDARIEIQLKYETKDLVELRSLELFSVNFVGSAHHDDQKKDIVRSSLIDLSKGKKVVTLAEILPRFEEFLDNVRSSYALFASDFSYEKIRSEVERQNLDDALRLNKTVSDIQNQLLALPAALVLAGAGIEKLHNLKNFAIWIGICIFGWMMRTLVVNQKNSLEAIKTEISLRKEKLSSQPEDIAKRFNKSFLALERRAAKQETVLSSIEKAVLLIWVVVTCMVVWVDYPAVFNYSIDAMGVWLSRICDWWRTLSQNN